MEPEEEKSRAAREAFNEYYANKSAQKDAARQSSVFAITSIVACLIIILSYIILFVPVFRDRIDPMLRGPEDGSWGPSKSVVFLNLFIILVHIVGIFSGFGSVFV